jgi:fructose-1,6-bisphosphatase class II
MKRTHALEFVRVTETAAIAASKWTGKGDKMAADQAAVDGMRKMLDTVDVDATVVIGEGERDEAPMLYIGEKVGNGHGDKLEIAVDPLEGTNITAAGGPNSIAVMAIGEEGNLLHAPDTYMKKIAVGPAAAKVVDINMSATDNVRAIAKAKGMPVDEITAIVLDRGRHTELIQELRDVGARIHLIGDGDVAAAIAAVMPDNGIDLLIGTGAAPEGVITAAAIRCLGGEFQGQLRWRSEEEKERAKKMGTDISETKVYRAEDLAKGNVMFVATGVTTGSFLEGVRFMPGNWAETHSIVMRSESGTVRYIKGVHDLNKKPGYN